MKKIIRDYIYFTETLEDIRLVSKNAACGFRKAIYTRTETVLEDLIQPGTVDERKAEEEKDEDDEDDEELVEIDDKNFKKLFRTLVLKCHPDKLTEEDDHVFLKKCYENLTLAHKTYKWGLLLTVAVELDAKIPLLTSEQFQNITDNLVDIKKNIGVVESSMAYTWYNISDPEPKKAYLEKCAVFLQEK